LDKLKILHLASDDKFVDHAFLVFEKAFPGKNDVLLLAKSKNLKYVKLTPKKIVLVKLSHKRTPKILESEYQNYDLVVFHSFGSLLYPEIYNIPQEIPTVWIGWGYDYYDLIDAPENLLLPETRKLAAQCRRSNIREIAGKILRFGFDLFGISKSREKAIEKVSIFSPVLPNEYSLVRNSHNWKKFPECARWNYGTIEDHLVKGFEDEQVNDNAILVGNNASFTCNHIETFNFLNVKGFQDRDIVVPLSYGDKIYGQRVAEAGERYFGRSFSPLMDFMPLQDYVAAIRKCGYVIMNHKRQQAVGNIVIMLYLGARVFVRQENPVYSFFMDMEVILSTVQELEANPALLKTPLTIEERAKNRILVSSYWARNEAHKRTQVLVEKALCLRGVKKPETIAELYK
jgi:dTDP-N-acetylfucosamine:lipid II N-acetylfucosaminyltransferase